MLTLDELERRKQSLSLQQQEKTDAYEQKQQLIRPARDKMFKIQAQLTEAQQTMEREHELLKQAAERQKADLSAYEEFRHTTNAELTALRTQSAEANQKMRAFFAQAKHEKACHHATEAAYYLNSAREYKALRSELSRKISALTTELKNARAAAYAVVATPNSEPFQAARMNFLRVKVEYQKAKAEHDSLVLQCNSLRYDLNLLRKRYENIQSEINSQPGLQFSDIADKNSIYIFVAN